MPEQWVELYQRVLSGVLIVALAAFAIYTWRWPLVGDAPLFHYIVFLMRHGMAPYRDIVDLNLPGTYAAQALVMRVVGEGAGAWRVYDFALLAAIGAAMASICGPGRRFAALFAATAFALIHGRDGLIDTGQRDLLMTALLMGGCAVLLAATKPGGGRLWRSAGIGLAVGAAATVKPVALLLLPVWLALLVRQLRVGRRGWAGPVGAAVAGALLPITAAGAALARWHAWDGFTGVMLHLVPLHTAIFRWPMLLLFAGSISSVMLGLFLLWLPLLIVQRAWHHAENVVLLTGFLFGVISYCLQGRGYPYHRYPSEAFFLLLAGLAFQKGLKDRRKWVMGLAVAGFAFGSLVIVPRSLSQIRHFDWRHDEFGSALGRDLQTLGGPALNGKVQCLDQAGGCVGVLYQLRFVQSSGFLYDCYLFVAPPNDAQARNQRWYRDEFARAWERHPPEYVVVTSDECGLRPPDFSYGKLERWPWLDGRLVSQYRIIREQAPVDKVAWGGLPALPYGYRIYRRKTEPDLAVSNK